MDEEFDVQAHVRESALKAFQFRRAIKVFDPGRDIPAADLDVIWEAARLSPTSNGLEPFNLIVLRDERVRARLKEEGGGGAQWVDAPVVVVITSKTGAQLHADSSYLRHMKLDVQGFPAEQLAQWQQSFAAFLRDKHGITTDDGLREWGRRQAYIVLGNIMTAAALLFVESCALEGIDYAAVDRVLAEEGLIDPAADTFAVGVALGYRAEDPKRERTRRPLNEIAAFR